LALPIQNERDIAGIIQCFEMTFELFWKVFQQLNILQGTPSNGPREALENAFHLKMISNDEIWVSALKDRNLTVHTYDDALAKEMIERVRHHYYPEFQKTLRLLIQLSKKFI